MIHRDQKDQKDYSKGVGLALNRPRNEFVEVLKTNMKIVRDVSKKSQTYAAQLEQ